MTCYLIAVQEFNLTHYENYRFINSFIEENPTYF